MEISASWTKHGLLVLFQSLLDTPGLNPLYLIIDDLHEGDSSWQEVLHLLLTVFSNDRLPTVLKVAIFCQERQDIREALEKFGKIHMNGPSLRENSQKLVVDALATRVINDNAYLWPLKDQITDVFDRCNDSTELLLAFHSLSNIDEDPRSLSSIKALTTALPPQVTGVVSTRFTGLKRWAKLALGWIAHAKRPLRLNELATAVAITDNKSNGAARFDEDILPLDTAAGIRSAFGPLLRVDTGYILFSTQAIKDCFIDLISKQQQYSEDKPSVEAHDHSFENIIPDDAQITKILLEYLSWTEFNDQIDKAHEGNEPV